MKLHTRIQEVIASNFDTTHIKRRRLPKYVMPKDSKNNFSCPIPCPAQYPTTGYFPMPQVNKTPTIDGFKGHPCSSEILTIFLWIMHSCQYVYAFISPDQCCSVMSNPAEIITTFQSIAPWQYVQWHSLSVRSDCPQQRIFLCQNPEKIMR